MESTLRNKSTTKRAISFERTAALVTWVLKCILLVPHLRPRIVVVKTQNLFSSHGGFLTIAMYHHREPI